MTSFLGSLDRAVDQYEKNQCQVQEGIKQRWSTLAPRMSPGGLRKIKKGAHLLFPALVWTFLVEPEHPGPPLHSGGLLENHGCSARPDKMEISPNRSGHPRP
uniref:Spermatogenesis associated 18 n=1 Tax=Bursaphelenchus xylophilus TaxID=6326 RepID=A0A1I7SN67_BURXY